jgi:hypothetical protein
MLVEIPLCKNKEEVIIKITRASPKAGGRHGCAMTHEEGHWSPMVRREETEL